MKIETTNKTIKRIKDLISYIRKDLTKFRKEIIILMTTIFLVLIGELFLWIKYPDLKVLSYFLIIFTLSTIITGLKNLKITLKDLALLEEEVKNLK